MVASADVSTNVSSATMKEASAVTPSVQFFPCRSSDPCIAALRLVGAGVAARHRSDEWESAEKTAAKIFFLAESFGEYRTSMGVRSTSFANHGVNDETDLDQVQSQARYGRQECGADCGGIRGA